MAQPRITGFSHVEDSVTDLEATTARYSELLGMVELFEQHDANPGTPFDERRVGLDHLSWGVESREELHAWLERLDALGNAHPEVAESELWDVLVFGDPDNVQLEFIHVKPAASGLIDSKV